MPSAYEIEMSEANSGHCDCCGGLTVRLTRFVYRGGDAFAIYYATYSNNHPENLVTFLVSIGEWGEGSAPEQRVSFFCRVRPAERYEVSLADASTSEWGKVELIGQKLTRAEALRHPLKSTAFEVLDEAFQVDRSLTGYMRRVECGDAAAPLEWSFNSPDDIFALGDDGASRAVAGRSFASLDDSRFFIRCLLPLTIEGYGTWRLGLWVEVTKADFDHAKLVWDDADQYPLLTFAGVVANDVAGSPDASMLPITIGEHVQVHVDEQNAPPQIVSPAVGTLADFIAKTWPQKDFEDFAIARGFL